MGPPASERMRIDRPPTEARDVPAYLALCCQGDGPSASEFLLRDRDD